MSIDYLFLFLLVCILAICVLIMRPQIAFGGGSEQDDALRKYRQFKTKKKLPTFEQFCFPTTFSMQNQQRFVGEYMRPRSGHKELLVFHAIGSGKTLTSIQIAEKWKGQGKPLIVMPASLIPGFRNELRSPLIEGYLTKTERAQLQVLPPDSPEYMRVIETSNARIDESYQIYSFNKFATVDVDAPVIIIDEFQNATNQHGVFFQSLVNWINSHPDSSVIIMSGTPIFDSPREIYSIAKLLRVEAQVIIPENIPKLFAGKVSYFAGAPAYTFPKALIKIKRCPMSKLQSFWYKSQVAAELSKMGKISLTEIKNDFYVKSRQRSNIVCPKGLTGDAGLELLTPAMIKSSLGTYSTKYNQIIKKLKKGELSFVYSGFTGAGGIGSLVKCLEVFGWCDFYANGPGRRRYAIWSGDQTLRKKDLVRSVYNAPANDDASQLQVIIGSPSIKEGVSLYRVQQVHVLELYWNHSRLAQIYGRAIRYCSHKTLPKKDRECVIYLYAAVCSKVSKEPHPEESIDLYMLSIAEKKKEETEPLINALMNVAVDRYLYGKN